MGVVDGFWSLGLLGFRLQRLVTALISDVGVSC